MIPLTTTGTSTITASRSKTLRPPQTFPAGWELHAIATFAGHRSTESTLTYIHLPGRDLAEQLNRSMQQVHGWRVEMLARPGGQTVGAGRA